MVKSSIKEVKDLIDTSLFNKFEKALSVCGYSDRSFSGVDKLKLIRCWKEIFLNVTALIKFLSWQIAVFPAYYLSADDLDIRPGFESVFVN